MVLYFSECNATIKTKMVPPVDGILGYFGLIAAILGRGAAIFYVLYKYRESYGCNQ